MISTAMLAAKGAVAYQTRILDGLGGTLDTSNAVQVMAAAAAGLDLMWIARKFLPTASVQPLVDAVAAVEQAYTTAKGLLVDAYDATVAVPLLGAPAVLKVGLEGADLTVRQTPKAAAFVAAFVGR